MEPIDFLKYQATGNDFVLIDDRENRLNLTPELIAKICDRRFGIGSDGLILIRTADDADFTMVFYNPDGSQSLCGNGSRCAVKFAERLGIVSGECSFLAYDGLHEAVVLPDGMVKLGMRDVQNVSNHDDGMFVDTGSPHLVCYVNDIDDVDVYGRGREIRYNNTYKQKGVNINFVELDEQAIRVRTYERGVENETFSCGTGVTAAAIASLQRGMKPPVSVITKGGDLSVSYQSNKDGTFSQIWLTGPAEEVFTGQIVLNQ